MKSFYKRCSVLPQPTEGAMEVLTPENYCPTDGCRWLDYAGGAEVDIQYTPYWDESYDEHMNFIFDDVVHEFSIGHTVIHFCPGCGAQLTRGSKYGEEAK